MTPAQRASLGYAPELAVLDVLRAAASASCAALAVAHPSSATQASEHDYALAMDIYSAIVELDRAIETYCNYVVASLNRDDDICF